MDKLKIYVDPPPAPRMPRLGLDRPNYHWRHLMWAFLACALICGVIGWVL